MISQYGLELGSAEIRAAGPIAFGPAGIMFLADNAAAKIYAVDLPDSGSPGSEPFDLENIDVRVGSLLGCNAADVLIRDIAVHPTSQNVYLSVQRGRGEDGRAVLIKVDRLDGSIVDLPLKNVALAEVVLADAPAQDDERLDVELPTDGSGEAINVAGRTIHILRRPIRTSTITDMAYIDGQLLVAGLSNEEFSSKLRRIPFPFGKVPMDNNLEIFHVSHGKWETASPIRAFVPYDGGRSILATYTCTSRAFSAD